MSPRTPRTWLALVVVAASSSWATAASAHITLEAPTARTTQQKTGPCGTGDSVRGDKVTEFEPGQTITVRWTETLNHTGHFRISFDADGQDDFADPQAYDDLYTNAAVLLDDIADTPNGGLSSVDITLPDIECERCTLQLVQVMTDKPPFGPGGGDDFYYQCADIALRATTLPVDEDVADLSDSSPPADGDVADDADDTASADTTPPGDTSPADTSTPDASPDSSSDTGSSPADTAAEVDTVTGGDSQGMEVALGDDPESDCACAVRTDPGPRPRRGALWLVALGLVGLVWRSRRRVGGRAGRRVAPAGRDRDRDTDRDRGRRGG